jgi:hypothetical protein
VAPPADSGPRGFDRGPSDSDAARLAVRSALADVRPLVTMSREGLVLVAVESTVAGQPRDYLTLAEAADRGEIEVREIAAAGAPAVEVAAQGANVVLLGGETILRGGRNLVVNATAWVTRQSRAEIPVTHLEGLRNAGGRLQLSRSNTGGRPEAGQQNAPGRLEVGPLVDHGVRSLLARIAVAGATHLHLGRLEEADLDTLRRAFPYPELATGLAVGLGGRIVGLDLFDHPETLERQWPRLVESAASALADYHRALRSGLIRPPHQRRPTPETLARLIDRATRAAATAAVAPSVGDGLDVRFAGGGVHGSALVHRGRAVHVAVFREAL